jgi:hypothetical protein
MKRKYLYLIIFLILLYIAGIASGFYKTEYQKKPVVKEKIDSQDVEYLYRFYFTSNPNIENRPYYGSDDADLILIVYTNIHSESARFFYESLYPSIEKSCRF